MAVLFVLCCWLCKFLQFDVDVDVGVDVELMVPVPVAVTVAVMAVALLRESAKDENLFLLLAITKVVAVRSTDDRWMKERQKLMLLNDNMAIRPKSKDGDNNDDDHHHHCRKNAYME
eukprot:231778_1